MSNYHPISIKRAFRLIELVFSPKRKDMTKGGVMIRGRHGIGKSEIVKQLGEKLNMPVIDMRAAQLAEGDVLGIPDKEEERRFTRFLPPHWFWLACESPCILFVDEIDRATLEVGQCFFELNDSRKIHGRELHPGTFVFSAVNSGMHGRHYNTNDLEPASLDRWLIIDLEPTVDEWIEWAVKEGVSDYITDFIRKHPEHLEFIGDQEPSVVYPSRRSWKRANDILEDNEIFNPLDKINDPKELDKSDYSDFFSTTFDLVYSCCGYQAAIEFETFLRKEYEFEVDVLKMMENIDKYLPKIRRLNIDEQTMIINKLEDKGYFKTKFKKNCKEVIELSKLYRAVPNELAIMIVNKIVNNITETGKEDSPYYYNTRWFWYYSPDGDEENTNGEYYITARDVKINYADYLDINLEEFVFFINEPEDSANFEIEWIFSMYELIMRRQIRRMQAKAKKLAELAELALEKEENNEECVA